MPRTSILLVVIAGLVAGCDQTATAPDDVPVAADPPVTAAVPDSVTLDFESVATSDVIALVGPAHAEGGYSIAATEDGVFSTMGSSSSNYAGSTGLFLNSRRDLDVVLTRTDGKPFSALAIDLAPLQKSGTTAAVTFVGTRADGSKVTQTHVTSTKMSFATFPLEAFTSLVELRWKQQFTDRRLHQFDKVVLKVAG